MNDVHKYEVALSFLQDDEQLALEIADRIRGRVSVGVFVYSERQDVLAGTDGVDAFSRIFGEQSLIVVILYRKGWGETKWTRVEENAIRTRGFNEGHEFVLLVKLDAASPPVWLPPTRLYLGFDRYGIDGVASAIELRVQSAGGSVRSETILDHATNVAREVDFRNELNRWRQSGQAVESAKQQAQLLLQELKRYSEEVSAERPQIPIEWNKPDQTLCGVSARGKGFTVSWFNYYDNYFDHAGLTFESSEIGRFVQGRSVRFRRKTGEVSYNVDLDLSRRVGWREQDSGRFFTTQQLAEFWIRDLLDKAYRKSM